MKISDESVDNILNVVKTIKSETSLDWDCTGTILSPAGIMSQVQAVEQKLQIESADQIGGALSLEKLQKAAEMFIYLNSCPKSRLKSWISFYKTLFLTQSTDQIILTLNRITKAKTSHDKDGNQSAEKLIQRIASLLSLKFVEIQRWLQGDEIGNGPVKDFHFPKGTHFLKLVSCNS